MQSLQVLGYALISIQLDCLLITNTHGICVRSGLPYNTDHLIP